MSSVQRIPTEPQLRATDRAGDDELDLVGLFQTLWRGKWIIAVFAAVMVLAGGFYSFRMTSPVYTAHAVIALDNRAERNVTSVESVVSGLSASTETVNTEIEVMTSRTLGERLVERLDLMNDPEFNPAVDTSDEPAFNLRKFLRSAMMAVLRIEEEEKVELSEAERFDRVVTRTLNRFEVSNDSWSYVFNVYATTYSPEKSVLLANTLADLYIEDQLQVKFDATAQATEWLSQRVAELRKDLEASESAAKEFNASIDLINAETLDALNRQLKDMRERLQTAQTTLAGARSDQERLEAAIDSGVRSDILAVADDPRLSRIASDIETGRAVEDSFAGRLDQLRQGQRLSVERLETQVASLERSVAEISAQVEKQSRDLVTLEQLQREAEADRLIYESFLVRLRETSIQQGIQTADARVISHAVTPLLPSAPRKSRIILMAGFMGVMLGSVFVVLMELRNRGFRTSPDLERATGHTVLGQIPLIPIRRRGKLISYLLEQPTSQAAESARNLRTSIELSNVDNPPAVIVSCSAVPGEGKTTTAIMLAHHFSALNRKVLLLEGDIRRNVFEQYVATKGRKGLVSVISGEVAFEDAVIRDDRLDFDILGGESSRVSAADLFASKHFAAVMKDLRAHYDHIVIDSPPVLVVPDARSIARHADALVFCVKWNATTARQVEQGLAAFETVDLKVTGLVLTHVSQRKMRQYGYGRYYGGYGYSAKYYGKR
ncbi:Wzz/FepE/Etk N-terminal domain-containing protein [Tropicimonas sp. IMCC6043]|uniref:GumC family protein n=1 Tax=Tropicimonas sp. IMCC6043 TaxID=2510645 RepID=UPI0013E9A733|nr:Wzz/FepE/Etk N-terminal domain-containing protein [Tropicimonas sp. IMCC6043]